MMNLLISLLVFALIFGGALAGMAVRPLLLEHHLHSDSKDVVKLTTGLIGTLTALVLGLLIASAKTTFDPLDPARPTRRFVDDLARRIASYQTRTIELAKKTMRARAPEALRERLPAAGRVRAEAGRAHRLHLPLVREENMTEGSRSALIVGAGASAGLGAAYTWCFAREGYKVVLADRSAD